MNKPKLYWIIIGLLCLTFNKVKAQTYQQFYGLAGDDDFRTMQRVPGSTDYIIAGTTTSAGAGSNDFYVARIQEDGTLVWDFVYGGAGSDIAVASVINNNGNIVIGGNTSSFTTTHDILIIELDMNGNLQWARTYGTAARQEDLTRINLSPTGIIISGNSYAVGSNAPDYLLFEVSNNGSTLNWENNLDSSSGDLSYGIIPRSLGGYIVVGGSHNTGNYEQTIIRLNADGSLNSAVSYGSNADEAAAEVIELTNGNLMVMGNYRRLAGTSATADLEFSLTLTDASFAIQSVIMYGDAALGIERANNFLQTADGGYAMAGWTNSYGQGGYDVYVIRTDANGNLTWARSYGSTANDYGNWLIENSDGGFTIAGYSSSGNLAGVNGYLIRTDVNGDAGLVSCTASTAIQTNAALASAALALTASNPALFNNAAALTTTNVGASVDPKTCITLRAIITSFSGVNVDGNNKLNWTTSSELNTSYFSIERSSDGVNYEAIGNVKGAGTSWSENTYNFIDNSPLNGNNYYRLKQIDIDGSFVYSNIEVVNSESGYLSVYPNPSKDIFKINLKLLEEPIHVEVVNSLGEVIVPLFEVNSESFIIDLSSERNGLYFVRLLSEKNALTYPIIKY